MIFDNWSISSQSDSVISSFDCLRLRISILFNLSHRASSPHSHSKHMIFVRRCRQKTYRDRVHFRLIPADRNHTNTCCFTFTLKNLHNSTSAYSLIILTHNRHQNLFWKLRRRRLSPNPIRVTHIILTNRKVCTFFLTHASSQYSHSQMGRYKKKNNNVKTSSTPLTTSSSSSVSNAFRHPRNYIPTTISDFLYVYDKRQTLFQERKTVHSDYLVIDTIIRTKFSSNVFLERALEYTRLAHTLSKGYSGPFPFEKWLVDIGVRSGFVRPLSEDEKVFVTSVSFWAFLQFIGRRKNEGDEDFQISRGVRDFLDSHF